jgi:hypothetical protein
MSVGSVARCLLQRERVCVVHLVRLKTVRPKKAGKQVGSGRALRDAGADCHRSQLGGRYTALRGPLSHSTHCELVLFSSLP